MAVDQSLIIKKLRNSEEFYVLFSQATKMPFVTCDKETFNDQVWIFDNEKQMQELAKQYIDQKIYLMGVKVLKANALVFYMNLHALGINEVVFGVGGELHHLELQQIAPLPDYSDIPENKRPLLNPQLLLTAVYFLQELRRPGVEPDKKLLHELEEEMSSNLAKADYIMPVSVVEEGEKKGSIRIPYVQNKQGEKYQPIFSDTGEIIKHYHSSKDKHNMLKVPFSKLENYLIDDSVGFLLNPEGIALAMKREQMKVLRDCFCEKPKAEE